MTNKTLIEKFYTSFQNKDYHGMIECYHDDIIFEDPGFGELHGEEAKSMWKMLLSRSNSDTKITFKDAEANDSSGSVKWTAKYTYGDKKRKVVNNISAKFKFKDGKIIDHRDHFNLWKWTSQALGMPGILLGWTPFMKKKLQQRTNKMLKKFMAKQ